MNGLKVVDVAEDCGEGGSENGDDCAGEDVERWEVLMKEGLTNRCADRHCSCRAAFETENISVLSGD